MLKQWHCLKRVGIFAAAPSVLTVTNDSLSFFPMGGGFVSVEMLLRDIAQVTPTAGLFFSPSRR